MRELKIDDGTLDLLANLEIDGNLVKRIKKQLDRPIYEKLNKVLEILGGKWNRGQQGHVFNDDPAAVIENAMMTGTVADLKKAYDFFETPESVTDELIAEASLGHGAGLSILEPSAGRGAILDRVRDRAEEADFYACEIQPENAEILKGKGYPVIALDFMKLRPSPENTFDRVIMNPPFSKQQDIDHVQHAYQFLKPGGILVAVMSAGVKFRTNRKTESFRQLVRGVDGAIYDLPPDSFKASGTGVNTVVVRIPK